MNELEFRKSLGYKEDIYYHYCSLSSLYGIVTSQSFWLTCLDSTNDAQELKLGKKILTIALEQLKELFKDSKYFPLFNRIMESVTDRNLKKFQHNHKYYGLSLVKNKDSLTHWERYGDNSKGVCVGINVRMIKHFLENYCLPEICTSWLESSKIYYSEEEQLEYVKSSLISSLDQIDAMLSNHTNELVNLELIMNNKNFNYIFNSIYYSLLHKIQPIFKHSGFSDEHEYRIYLQEGEVERDIEFYKRNSSDDNDPFLGLSKNILSAATNLNILESDKKYSVFKDGIRSYYSMNLSEVWSDTLIQEVIIGPKCTQNKNELKNFFKANDLYNTKISISKIPIR